MDAELVLDGGGAKRIVFAHRPVLVHKSARGEEEGDALHSRRSVGQAGKDEVDDVVRHVVIPPGDVDFLPGDAVTTLPVWLRAGAEERQV